MVVYNLEFTINDHKALEANIVENQINDNTMGEAKNRWTGAVLSKPKV